MPAPKLLAALRRRLTSHCLRSLSTIEAREFIAGQLQRLPPVEISGVIERAFRHLPASAALALKTCLGVVETLDYPGGDIRLAMRAPGEYPRRFACQKEPWTVRWIETFVRPGDVLFDVGANVGAYSLVAAKHTQARARVFAFEPAFVNYVSLCENVLLNGCDGCIVPLPLALSDRHQLDYFNYANLDPGGALHTLGEQRDYRGFDFRPVYRQPVLAYGIDQLVATLGFPLPNHLKIDVDGTEMDVLRGAETTLANPAVSSLMVESCELRVPSATVIGFLADKGLRLAERNDRANPEGGPPIVSYLQFSRVP